MIFKIRHLKWGNYAAYSGRTKIVDSSTLWNLVDYLYRKYQKLEFVGEFAEDAARLVEKFRKIELETFEMYKKVK